MTNKEYLQGKLSPFGVSDLTITTFCLDAGLSESAVVSNTELLKIAIYEGIPSLFAASSITEGGYSVSFNVEGLKKYYSFLATELGYNDVLNPNVSNASNIW